MTNVNWKSENPKLFKLKELTQDREALSSINALNGLSAEEICHKIHHNPVMYAEDISLFQGNAFRYYLLYFVKYLQSSQSENNAASASSIMTLIEFKIRKDIDSIEPIKQELCNILKFIGERQNYYNADEEVFGNFKFRSEILTQKILGN